MLPLWIADALMFAAVFLTAAPGIMNGEPMGALQTLFCCLLVAAAMGMILYAYKLNASVRLKEAEKAVEESEKEREIIFGDLASLRLMIADSNEKIENLEFAAENAKASAEKTAALESGIAVLRDSAAKKISELAESLESAAARADAASAKNCAALKKDLSVFNVEFLELKENFSRESGELKKALAEIREQIAGLEAALAEAQATALEESSEGEPGADQSELSGVLTRALSNGGGVRGTVEKFVGFKKPAKPVELSDEPNVFTEGQRADDFQGTLDNLRNPDAAPIPGQEPTDDGEKLNRQPNVFNEGERADDFQGTLDRLENPDAAQIPGQGDGARRTFDGGVMDAQGDNEDFFESADSESRDDAPESAEENALKQAGETSPRPAGAESKTEAKPKAKAEPEPEPKTEPEQEAKPKAEPKAEAEPKPEAGPREGAEGAENGFLFGDMPIGSPRKSRPTKRDAVIEVNALIGIGNKPYLRGSGAGLSMDKGVPMEFVEIGKWRYVLVELSEPVRIKILKNDEDAPNEEIPDSVSAGEKLELNLSFPQKESTY